MSHTTHKHRRHCSVSLLINIDILFIDKKTVIISFEYLTRRIKQTVIWKAYLGDSLRAPVSHHLTPTSHHWNPENHTHQNPRNQTHFPKLQTQPTVNFKQNQNINSKNKNNKIVIKRNKLLTREHKVPKGNRNNIWTQVN